MPRQSHVYYVRCLDDEIPVRPSLSMLGLMMMTPTVTRDANGQLKIEHPEPPKLRMVKLNHVITKGHCYKATLFLKDPLSRVQLLETNRGKLSKRLQHNSGKLKHGVFAHKRFQKITREEYETWQRSKTQ